MLLLLFVPPYFRRFVVLTLGSTIAITICAILVAGVRVVHAQSYNYSSYTQCRPPTAPNEVVGYSELTWSSQPSSAWGRTVGRLWWWDGSTVQIIDDFDVTVTGSNRIAGGHNYSGSSFPAGNWQETGAHTASFFSGTINSQGFQTYCS